MTTILQIRFELEQRVKEPLEVSDVINWCNDAQTEVMMMVDIPGSMSINVNTEDLDYPLGATDIKRINRLWLQSERDAGVDRDLPNPYRIYQGKLIFGYRFGQEDTLNIDFYRYLKTFTSSSDSIDLDDREVPLYTSYCLAQYYDLPHVVERLGEAQARKRYEQHYGRHMVMRESIAARNVAAEQPATIKEVW